jgi:hypothetical protein
MTLFCDPDRKSSDDTDKTKSDVVVDPQIAESGESCKVDSVPFGAGRPPEAIIRWDRFLFVLGLFAFSVTALLFLRRIVSGAGSVEHPTLQNKAISDVKLEHYLVEDVQRAFERGDALFARSSLMLIAGILVAFLGIVAFALLTSSPSTYFDTLDIRFAMPRDESGAARVGVDQFEKVRANDFFYGTIRYVLSNLRFVLIFVFVETVAWFLLKQYRALIEDYKTFYRVYLRRQNYTSSYLMLKKRPLDQSAETLIAAAMLNEDLSGILSRGQELDSRAQLEFAERNSFSAITNFFERIVQSGRSTAGASKTAEQGVHEERSKAVDEANQKKTG